MLAGERLLIIEEVFLIAIDIQLALEGAAVAGSMVVRDFEAARALADRFASFDLAVINAPQPDTPAMETAAALRAAGVPIVVCTAGNIDLAGTPLDGVEIVRKPFSDSVLLTACERALARRQR